MTNHEGQLPNDAGEQSREAAVQAQSVPAQPGPASSLGLAAPGLAASGLASVGSALAGSPTANASTVNGATASDATEAKPAKTVSPAAKKKREAGSGEAGANVTSNNVRRIRIELMLSKAEVARRANISVLTLDRVERGYGCRVDTKRKILEALGLSLADRIRVFGEEE
jgi:DNA-binding transcriptional regulator YiaG